MKNSTGMFVIILAIFGTASATSVQWSSSTFNHWPQPQAEEQKVKGQTDNRHERHHSDVNERGDQVMGFDHGKTTHSFRLKRDGGIIEVQANDLEDTASRDRIRRHLRHIAQKFAEGDFTAPMLIHAQTPPGVPTIKQLKADIKYQFRETKRGGLVRIVTANVKAVAAIHEFLRFQIEDHQTGDSGEVETAR